MLQPEPRKTPGPTNLPLSPHRERLLRLRGPKRLMCGRVKFRFGLQVIRQILLSNRVVELAPLDGHLLDADESLQLASRRVVLDASQPDRSVDGKGACGGSDADGAVGVEVAVEEAELGRLLFLLLPRP